MVPNTQRRNTNKTLEEPYAHTLMITLAIASFSPKRWSVSEVKLGQSYANSTKFESVAGAIVPIIK